jgi:hypothetical protein
MRSDPSTVLQAVLANVVVLVGFIGVAVAMVRRARDPKTIPRDKLEAATLLHLKHPTKREKLYFVVLLAVGLAAPWLTRYFTT